MVKATRDGPSEATAQTWAQNGAQPGGIGPALCIGLVGGCFKDDGADMNWSIHLPRQPQKQVSCEQGSHRCPTCHDAHAGLGVTPPSVT